MKFLLLAFNYISNINIESLLSSRKCKHFCELSGNLLLHRLLAFFVYFWGYKHKLGNFLSANSWLRTFFLSEVRSKFNETSGVCIQQTQTCIAEHLLATSFIFIESDVVRREKANIMIQPYTTLFTSFFNGNVERRMNLGRDVEENDSWEFSIPKFLGSVDMISNALLTYALGWLGKVRENKECLPT